MGVIKRFKSCNKKVAQTNTHTDGHHHLETELARWADTMKMNFTTSILRLLVFYKYFFFNPARGRH
jgi:hypothetical protein